MLDARLLRTDPDAVARNLARRGFVLDVGRFRAPRNNPVPNIIYSVSPKHTDDYFAERTRHAASLKTNRLCLKDPGGLLTPERLRTLVPIIFQNANGIAVELHTHCTTVSDRCAASRRLSWASRLSIPPCRRWRTAHPILRSSTSRETCARWDTTP